MPPKTRRKQPATVPPRSASGALPYGVNVKLTHDQHEALAELEHREGISRSAAIRRAIDEWREAGRMEVGTVQGIGFTGVPELDHVEVALVTEVDGRTARMEFNLDVDQAHELLAELASAVDSLEGDR